MTARQSDFTPVIDLLREKGTGPVRENRPVYADLMPPCNNACPAGENVQAWLDLAQAGKFQEAWRAILRDNPFPAVHGRVCYHPCETSCNRAQLDSAVSIHAVERFLGDLATEQGWTPDEPAASSGKRVLVVGGGPSGLSAAYHLARLGHAVEVQEAGPLPGGMLHFGIPAYRLPRAELMKEIARIEAMGVRIVLNHKVEDILAEQAAGSFDAVFVAIGTQIGKKIDIPARDAAKVIDAIKLLHDVETGEAPSLGRRVIVYGGGNTAMDAARMARRLGAEETLIVYRRDRAHMPAQAFEADEALSEGVKIKWLSAIKDIGEDSLTVETMRLDESGRPQPTGEFETLSADSVVLALGQQTDCGFLRNAPGVAFTADDLVIVDSNMMTGRPGVFAGGDMAPGQRSVTAAVGHGKKAARAIDAFLRGAAAQTSVKHPIATFDLLHLPIYADAPPSVQSEMPVAERLAHGFAETMAGLSEAQAHHEARRCLSCGNCFECDQCYAACPEQAIVKLGPGRRYLFDYARCTGCGVCFEQCPCHAIEMKPEPARTAPEASA
ncbi:NAD(P)-binding protein [Rhodoblastus sp. 17X3]|uniref:NAD(P)-binding protein n=1 Tax=Rhodoblastus sp. 17X3 TaxID=3047026 RepID=UPI0024B72A48|nr:NAD(P)-binding protein [Rhodoblastus sp. 17X3]MDI9849836.1 NAD(P)-binding protein [Rhodoblastus sp. 17X3]